MKRSVVLFIIGVFALGFTVRAQLLTNPLLPSGADPYSYYKDGYYYYTHTTGNRIELWKTKDLSALKDRVFCQRMLDRFLCIGYVNR